MTETDRADQISARLAAMTCDLYHEHDGSEGDCAYMIDHATLAELLARVEAAERAGAVKALAEEIAALQSPAEEQLRDHAYYFGFDLTGVGAVDRTLSAVCAAGKGYHHTERWSDTDPKWQPKSHVELIQEAANAAATSIRALDCQSAQENGATL